MGSDTVFDNIIQNLEFEVKAVHEDNTEQFVSVENGTPLNVKIRVRKNNKTGVLYPGFISVPKFVQSNKMPNKIRLVNSDQTIVSFNILMESDYGQNNIVPSKRKHFFGVFKSGGCMDPQNGDDDDYSYMPSSSARNPKTNSIVINTSNYKLKMKSNGKNVNVGNLSPKKNEQKKTKEQKRFFGYCKPGGCLDPPFNEDQYSYKPSYLEKTIFPVKKNTSLVRESEKNKNLDLIDRNEIVKLKNRSKDNSSKASEQEKVDSKTIISIFHSDSMKISLDTTYSNSIITYPPTLTSSEQYLSEKRSENNAKNATIYVKKVSKPSNEYNDSFFVPPKKNSICNKTREIVEVLRDPTGLETVLSQVNKEMDNNANNDTVISKDGKQHLSLLRSRTIQSDFDKLDLLTREASCSTRRDSKNCDIVSIKLKNNSHELKKIPTNNSSKPSSTHKIISSSGQNIPIGDFEIIRDMKSSKHVSKYKIDIHNDIKCCKLGKSISSHLQIEKRLKNSATNSGEIGKEFTDYFTKTNIIEKKDNIESMDAIVKSMDTLTCIKNGEIIELNHSSSFDSIVFKNEQGLNNSIKKYFLVSNSDIKKNLKNQDINLSSNDITPNEKQSYSDKNSNRVDEKPMVNSDELILSSKTNHRNKVIANESKIMSNIRCDFISLVPKNKSDHSNIKSIIYTSSKTNPTSSDDSEKSKNLEKSNDYTENNSIIKERKFYNSTDSHNYLTQGKRQLTNSSRAESPNWLDLVSINDIPSMKPLSTQVIHGTENTTEYIEKESKCDERKSYTSTDSKNYLSKSISQPTNSSCEDSPNLIDSLTLNFKPSTEPLTALTHNISHENRNSYVEKYSKINKEMSQNSTDSHNYLTKSDRQLKNSSLTDSMNLLDSVTLNDIPLMEPLSIPLSHDKSTENTNTYVEKEGKIKKEISYNFNDSHNYLNNTDRQLTSSNCLNSLNLLDSVILNERPLIEPLSIPLPHNMVTENTSNYLFKKSQNNESDELCKQSKINVIEHQNLTIFNSSTNSDNHDVDADITKKNENIELETKHYDNKSINDNRFKNKKLIDVSPENESKVSSFSFKMHENAFEKPSKISLPIEDLKKIEESPNLKPINKNSQSKLLLYIDERSEHNEKKTLQAIDADPNENIENLSKSIYSDSQSSGKLLSPTSPSYIFSVEQTKNKFKEPWRKLLDNDSIGENIPIENLITKSDNNEYDANQDQDFVTILPEGDKVNNISKTQINSISESLCDFFNRSGKSISSSTKIKNGIDRNETLANSYLKTMTKYYLAGTDSTTKETTQFSHAFQSEKSQNAVFYDDAASSLKENNINYILNKDSVYVNNTMVRDTASIKHAVITNSEILSEKRLTDDKQFLMDSELLLLNKNKICQGSLKKLYKKNAISHHNLLNLISKESTNNSVPDAKFASKSKIKSEIILDLGFQSYYNYEKNQRVLKSLDTSIVNARYPHDAVTVIKSTNLHDSEIKISVDSEIDICIQTLQKNKITLDKHQKVNHNNEDNKSISKKKLIHEDKTKTKDNCEVSKDVAQSYEIAIENTLKSVYEQQLIPLHDMIRNLKSEIDYLADQQSEVRGTMFKSNLHPTHRTRSVRLIGTNKRCRCLNK